MTDITDPVLDTADSTAPVADAVDSIDTNLDVQTSAFDELLGDMEFFDPQADADKPEVELEVSEEDELDTSEDDSNIDESDEDEDVVEDEEQDTSDSVVDWDEMRQHSFEIDGKTYSANDLKAALGRQAKQQEAHNEVETAKAELAAERESLETQRAHIEMSQTAMQGRQKMAQLEETFSALIAERDQALEENNTDVLAVANARIQQVQQAWNQVKVETEQAQQEQVAHAVQQLNKLGYGDIISDTQRNGLFKEYAKANVPSNLNEVVRTSPELLMIIEKARLFDKSNNEATRGKLKSAKKTLKSRAAKTKSPVKKQADPMKALADSVIDDIFNS